MSVLVDFYSYFIIIATQKVFLVVLRVVNIRFKLISRYTRISCRESFDCNFIFVSVGSKNGPFANHHLLRLCRHLENCAEKIKP